MTQTAGRLLTPVFDVHDRCFKARREAGLEIEELAERIGCHRHTITNYETGATTRLKRSILRRWADETGVDYEWLADGVGVTSRYLESPADQRVLEPV